MSLRTPVKRKNKNSIVSNHKSLNISGSNVSSRNPSPIESLKKKSKQTKISARIKLNDN